MHFSWIAFTSTSVYCGNSKCLTFACSSNESSSTKGLLFWVGAFSTASFLCPNEFYNFVDKRINPRVKLFLYVGRRETSDGSYDEELYFNASKKLYAIATKHFARVRMVVSDSGTHCEACWDKNLIDFFSFIYSDNIIYKY